MVKFAIDDKLGYSNCFRDNFDNPIGSLPYWFSLCEIVSVKEALSSKDKFVYAVNLPSVTASLSEWNLEFLQNGLVDAINSGQCKFVINDSMEGSLWGPEQVHNFLFWLGDIDPSKVIVINQNYDTKDIHPFKIVQWSFFESYMRVKAPKEIQTVEGAKKFLCLNRWPRQHRFDFLLQMYKHDILDQFNYSYPTNAAFPTIEPPDELPYWITPNHKKYSMLYIVTETFWNNNLTRDVSEKTWKPIAMRMPFIMIHQPFALRRLRGLGYMTFHTLWNEDYDDIVNNRKRMSAIVDLVVSLNSRKDFVELIKSCRGIVEHNFEILKMRRPESEMIREITNEMV